MIEVDVIHTEIVVETTRKQVNVEIGPLSRLQAAEDRITLNEAQLAWLAGLQLSLKAAAWGGACIAAGAPVSMDRLLLMDRLVFKPLADANLPVDGLFLVNESLIASAINLIAPGIVSTINGSPPFVADRYIQGNGSAYINTHVALPGAHYVQDSAFAMVRQVSDTRDNSSAMLGSSGGKVLLIPGNVGSDQGPSLKVRANTSVTDTALQVLGNAVGLYGWIRTASGQFVTMADRAVSETIVHASEPISGEMYLLRGGFQFGTGKGFAWAWGAGLNNSQWAALVDIINNYGRAVGAFI